MTMRAAFLRRACRWRRGRFADRSDTFAGWTAACSSVFHLDGQVADDLTLAFLFGAGGWLCQCISAVFLALFTARQDYARLASISIVSTVVSTSSMLVLDTALAAGIDVSRLPGAGLCHGAAAVICAFAPGGAVNGSRARRFIAGRSAVWSISEAGSSPRKAAA